jgi:hypothetical protein
MDISRSEIPKEDRYSDGQTTPTPHGIDFKPGTLFGTVSGELGPRKYLEENGHQFAPGGAIPPNGRVLAFASTHHQTRA